MEKQKKSSFVQAGEKYLIRFPEGMRERLAETAKANNRSMNAEIVARLERSLADDERAREPAYEIDPEELAEIERKAKEWGCSKTRALIRMTLEEVEEKRGGSAPR